MSNMKCKVLVRHLEMVGYLENDINKIINQPGVWDAKIALVAVDRFIMATVMYDYDEEEDNVG